jgi:hypothetical protein
MHLFILDLYISLDTLTPIINFLNPKKIIVCNTNAIQNYREDKLLKYLLSKKIKYLNFVPINQKAKIVFFIIKLISLLPCALQKKFKFFFNYIYHNYNFSSEKLIKNFLIKNKVISVTYEASSRHCVKEFYFAAKDLNIPVIQVSGGIDIDFKKKKFGNESVKFCNYLLTANKIRDVNIKNINFEIKYFGSARYSLPWINNLKLIYNYKKKKKSKKKINIGIFTEHEVSRGKYEIKKLVEKLKTKNNFEIKTREKPRDIRPLKCASFNIDEFSSSELIEWSDIIISARATSVLLEAIIKNKKIIIPSYITNEVRKSHVYKSSFIKIAKSENQLFNFLFHDNKEISSKKDKKNFLSKFQINFYKKNKIPNIIKNFYQEM